MKNSLILEYSIGQHLACIIEDFFLSRGIFLPKRVAVAFSGGSDSYALLKSFSLFARRRNIVVYALIVDHAYQSSSHDDAIRAYRCAVKNGCIAYILKNNDCNACFSHRRARLIRYNLIASFCLEKRIRYVLFGHTLNDHVENFCIRLRNTSSLFSLGSMSACDPYPIWPEGHGIVVLRPFLSVDRCFLRKYLIASEEHWIDDHANNSFSFLRGRLRFALSRSESVTKRIIPYLHQASCHRRKVLCLLKRDIIRVQDSPFGFFYIAENYISALLLKKQYSYVARLFAYIMLAVSNQYPPMAALKRALQRRYYLNGFHLSGCFVRRSNSAIFIGRDFRSLCTNLSKNSQGDIAFFVKEGSYCLWDHRYIIYGPCLILPLGYLLRKKNSMYNGLNLQYRFPYAFLHSVPVVIHEYNVCDVSFFSCIIRRRLSHSLCVINHFCNT